MHEGRDVRGDWAQRVPRGFFAVDGTMERQLWGGAQLKEKKGRTKIYAAVHEKEPI